ncbi:MAG: hypothetical protein KME26_13040 [Oscillatoria princeps RMCB-10]|nr:hypothetical protein [Oscillatoria princeps RMCB-10]
MGTLAFQPETAAIAGLTADQGCHRTQYQGISYTDAINRVWVQGREKTGISLWAAVGCCVWAPAHSPPVCPLGRPQQQGALLKRTLHLNWQAI